MIVNRGADRTTRAWAPEMARERICARKVFRAPWTTRAERIGNLKFLLDIDPLGVFELHIPTRNKEGFTTNVVTLPVSLEIVRILARDKVARTILDRLDKTSLL